MAGAGAKKFPAFSKLSSDDVNGYLSSQVIMRFATTTARDAAFGGTGEFTLAEGMTCYIDDLNVVQTYDGSNWITTTALQTTPNVSDGLVYITSGALSGSSTNFVNCFSSTYDNYRIVIRSIQFAPVYGALFFRLLNNTTPANTADYSWGFVGLKENGTTATSNFAGSTQGFTGSDSDVASIAIGSSSMDCCSPMISERTLFTVQAMGYAAGFFGRSGFSHHNLSNQYNGIQFVTNGVNVTGQVSIYGYRK